MKQILEDLKQKLGDLKQKCMGAFREKLLPSLKKIHPVYGPLCLICAVSLAGGLIYVAVASSRRDQSHEEFQELAQYVIQSEEPESQEVSEEDQEVDIDEAMEQEIEEQRAELPKDPYERKFDFDKLQKEKNADIYAWIYIPGTPVDYPIFQHPTDNSYYLNHNMNGSTGYPGCIYTEDYNAKDFLDPNTVIYGHNMKNGTMFGSIHNFLDQKYMEENQYLYIYTKDNMYVYEIFSAYEAGNEHLLADVDSSGEGYLDNYLDQVGRMTERGGVMREEESLEEGDRIVTLSTCISGQNEKRLLLQAVICKEVPQG